MCLPKLLEVTKCCWVSMARYECGCCDYCPFCKDENPVMVFIYEFMRKCKVETIPQRQSVGLKD